MCRELEVNGSTVPVFHTDDFILKVTVAKVTVAKVTEKVKGNRKQRKGNRKGNRKQRKVDRKVTRKTK